MEDSVLVCIVDYGSGNVQSVYNIFKNLHSTVIVSNAPEDLNKATHIVLPGVGAFGTAMEKLQKLLLIPLLEKEVLKQRKPFLGICVGMQILAEQGFEYGTFKGLGWIPGVVKKIEAPGLLLPHVGWNNFKIPNPTPLLAGISEEMDFYFVNSFCFEAQDSKCVNAVCFYGQEFPAVISRDNMMGVQFHPEKSQKAGKILIRNFLNMR